MIVQQLFANVAAFPQSTEEYFLEALQRSHCSQDGIVRAAKIYIDQELAWMHGQNNTMALQFCSEGGKEDAAKVNKTILADAEHISIGEMKILDQKRPASLAKEGNLTIQDKHMLYIQRAELLKGLPLMELRRKLENQIGADILGPATLRYMPDETTVDQHGCTLTKHIAIDTSQAPDPSSLRVIFQAISEPAMIRPKAPTRDLGKDFKEGVREMGRYSDERKKLLETLEVEGRPPIFAFDEHDLVVEEGNLKKFLEPAAHL